jgi:hypothetical protein
MAELIDLEWGEHLIESLSEIGFASSGMAGAVPISYQEIAAWQQLTNTTMPGYEALQIKQLSKDYCGEYHAANKPHRPKPVETEDETRDHVSQSFGAMVKHLKKEQKR